jgi:hypothetical protein
MFSSDNLQESFCQDLADILGSNPTWALNLRYGLRYRSIHVSGRDKTLRVVIGHSRTSDGFEVNVVDFGMRVGSFHLVAP